jgi:hypothetical protein
MATLAAPELRRTPFSPAAWILFSTNMSVRPELQEGKLLH